MIHSGERESATDDPATTLFCRALERPARGTEGEVGPEEVGHLRAARVRPGDPIAITDGRGARWSAELLALERRVARFRLVAPLDDARSFPLDLLVPVAQRDRSLWLVEKAVELSVGRIVWVEWTRSRSVADAGRSRGFMERAERRAIAAMKQSGGAWLPGLSPPEAPREALARAASSSSGRWLADAAGEPALDVVADTGEVERMTVVVGPEGGLTDPERDACLDAGYRPVRLGTRTLRFETAAIAMSALAVAALEDTAVRRRRSRS
ncbi:MAG: RsmE family RNA methyltransferase [Gemmatimonadota bacterium]|nr:RsmE family RNA methyltransferase [Gemmatimonadota bacterium]